MTTRIRTQITIQTRQRIVVRPLRDSFQAWCEPCLEVVPAITPETACRFLHISIETLHGLLAGGKLHAVEATNQSRLICCNSLSTNATRNEMLIEGERR